MASYWHLLAVSVLGYAHSGCSSSVSGIPGSTENDTSSPATDTASPSPTPISSTTTAVQSSTGASTTEQVSPPTAEDFVLLFEDEFDSLDTNRWQKASHTFDENAAQFDESNVSIVDGRLVLRLDKAEVESSEGKIYRGGELRTKEFFSYGRFEAKIQFAKGPGMISSFFTFYDHYSSPDLEENWNEIDIEYVGKHENQIQYNVIHWNAQSRRTTHEHEVPFDFDPTADFHVYAIEWLPTVVNFYVDGTLVHSQTDQIADFLTLDSRLMMNIWPVIPELATWTGTLDESLLPAEAKYDWVRVYEYVGDWNASHDVP